MGLLKNLWYILLAIIVISVIGGVILLVVAAGAVLTTIGITALVIWIVAWIIRSIFESKG